MDWYKIMQKMGKELNLVIQLMDTKMGLGNYFMKTVNLAWKTFTKMENLSKQPKDGIVMVSFQKMIINI